MTKFFIVGALLAAVVSLVPDELAFKPDFEQAHNAFVCNYLGTVCRDKMSVLPVSWQRYTP